jgi:hypothetical protein
MRGAFSTWRRCAHERLGRRSDCHHTAWQWPLDFAGYDIQRPCLEDISFDALSRLRHATSSHKRLRSDVLRVSRALAGLGLIPRALNPWVRDRSSAPDRRPHSRRDAAVVSNIAIAPEWRACVERWRDTTTLSPKARSAYVSQLLMIGRWASDTYGGSAAPARWSREKRSARAPRPGNRGASTIWATATARTTSSTSARIAWHARSVPSIDQRAVRRRSSWKGKPGCGSRRGWCHRV